METPIIDLRTLAVTFLTKLDQRFTPEEQAVILDILNKGIDNLAEVIKEFLDPKRREEILLQAKGLFDQHKDSIQEIGFQLDERFN